MNDEEASVRSAVKNDFLSTLIANNKFFLRTINDIEFLVKKQQKCILN